jgi:hypothetical protein
MRLVRSRPWRALLAAAGVLTALALPASASALTFHIVNESGKPASEVFVDIAAGGAFDVEGFTNDHPVALSEIPGQEVTINELISGRVYVSYGAPVQEGVTIQSPTRFDWAELTVTPVPEDAANLTAVNQFAIGMRLTTFGAGGEELESVGSTNANTIFDALQGIPGGPESTVRGACGEILRVLSPDNPGSAYPPLNQYVESMAGQTIKLHTAFFGTPFTTSDYSGEFDPDGSITLKGTESFEENGEVKEGPGPEISFGGQELIEDIYSGGNTPNDLEGAVRRDVLAGFSLGLWGGKYGNDAIDFCTNPNTTPQGTWCPTGFNVPAFAEARTTPAPFPAYEQYAAVINQYSDIYGNPYSDASKKVQVALDQPHVKTLQLTILPDSPPASSAGGNTGGSNSAVAGPPTPSQALVSKPPASRVTFKLAKAARFEHGKLAIGKLVCDGACGKVAVLLRSAKGKGVIARLASTVRKKNDTLVLKPTKAGKRLIAAGKAKRSKLTVTVTQPGHSPSTKQSALRITG